jgi:uncharacterized protein YbjT (DUF2867 family)
MKKIILFGATGHLGKAIAEQAKLHGFDVTSVIRNENKIGQLALPNENYIVADVTNQASLNGICNGFDIVISALGKSVSPFDESKPSFNDIDFTANAYILDEAKKSSIKKFIYISALHMEQYLHLEYFRVHHLFSELLLSSGINYSIIKPPALFSGYLDMITMARKGRLINIGNGNKKTNPIHESDVAKVCINSINENNTIVEIGGKSIYTRRQINEIIQHEVNPAKKIISIPIWLFKFSLPFYKFFNKNMYDKYAFFCEVIQHDTIAPQVGESNFEMYIKEKK